MTPGHRLNILLIPLLIAIFAIATPTRIHAISAPIVPTAHSADSLRNLLAKAKTPADSVYLLHNIIDCMSGDFRPVIEQTFYTAERAKDYDSMLELLFRLTVLYQYDFSVQDQIYKMAERIPDSEQKKITLLYTKVRYQATEHNNISEAERQDALRKALNEYRSRDQLNKYDRIACLFLIVNNLRNDSDSQLLLHYLDQLQQMIEEFPSDELLMRILFYTIANTAYLENNLFDKAVAGNKRMLDIIDLYDRKQEAQGRIFRTYDGSLFNCYYNLLLCARELPDVDVEDAYNHILEIAQRNARIKADTNLRERARIRYLMAKKRYAEALPLIKHQFATAQLDNIQYFHLSTGLIKAARKTGDKAALLDGLKRVNTIYRDRLKAKPDVVLSKIQTFNDIETLKKENKDLTSENDRIRSDRRRQAIIAGSIMVVILIGLLIWLTSLLMLSRRLGRRLARSNKQILEERNSLNTVNSKLVALRDIAKDAENIKNDFVANMGDEIREPLNTIIEYSQLVTDSAKTENKLFLQKYADALSVNADLLVRLVNDVLDLPKIENGELSIRRAPASVNTICSTVLSLVEKHVSPSVKLIFSNASQPDTEILTDPQRVCQVLMQILTNAAKFTEEGSITLDYDISTDAGTITFTVTDTGTGITPKMQDKIFDQFFKVDPTAQGSGLGLYVGRLIATMLGGTLTLDPSYTTGARFHLTIPTR